MSITEASHIWFDGRLVPWRDAQLHVLSLAVQFGSSVFEGVRCYETKSGAPAVFRLHEHVERLAHSCRVFRMEHPYDADAIVAACLETVAANGLGDCYVRPMVLRGYGAAGMLPVGSPVHVVIPAWPWGAYLGADALERGVDVCVSSWQRAEPNTFPVTAKAAGNYNNAQLIKMEAVANGYAEGIALNTHGLVSEGSGQNLFVVKKGALVTPPIDGSNLAGITRDAVIQLAGDLGIAVREAPVPRETLYSADELFFTGTASEVTPIRSVDRVAIGAGAAGPVTKAIQRRFLQTVRGEVPDERGWLTPVRPATREARLAS